MYNTAVLLHFLCKMSTVMSSVVAVVPWRLDPRQPQEGVNFHKTWAVPRLRAFFIFEILWLTFFQDAFL